MSSIRQALTQGSTIRDRNGRAILYRYLTPTDDLELLTGMLHEAYAPLAVAGMRFVATHQDADVTRRRVEKGETLVAADCGTIVGVVTLADAAKTRGCPYYDRPDVASFGQFAVRPTYQRCGIGSTLMGLVEARAREQGIAALGLDTAEHATELIAFYTARGYTFIEFADWHATNYRSMVFGKSLRPGDTG